MRPSDQRAGLWLVCQPDMCAPADHKKVVMKDAESYFPEPSERVGGKISNAWAWHQVRAQPRSPSTRVGTHLSPVAIAAACTQCLSTQQLLRLPAVPTQDYGYWYSDPTVNE